MFPLILFPIFLYIWELNFILLKNYVLHWNFATDIISLQHDATWFQYKVSVLQLHWHNFISLFLSGWNLHRRKLSSQNKHYKQNYQPLLFKRNMLEIFQRAINVNDKVNLEWLVLTKCQEYNAKYCLHNTILIMLLNTKKT